jgi:multiple sugar transport system substrate-binding protein/arabinosaccharide transport system substrate-binding protein
MAYPKRLSRRQFMQMSAGGLAAAALPRLPQWRPAWQQGPQNVTGDVTIWGYTGTSDSFKAAKDTLEKKYAGLKIAVQDFSYLEAHANILNALTSGIGVPELVNFDVDYVGDFAAGMLDLTERFKAFEDQFVPIAVQLARSGDKLCGLPQDNEPMGMAYRADIFEKYGLKEDAITTWDEYIEAGLKLWKDSGEKIKMISMDAPGSQMPVLGGPHQIHEVFFHLAGYHGVFFNKADDKVIIDEPNAVAAIEVFKKVVDSGVAFTAQTTDASVAAYKAGLVATNICPAWWPLGLKSQLADQSGLWRIMRLPALKKDGLRAAFQIPTVTGIPAQAANPDGAWGVLYDTQLTQEAQMKFYEVTGGILPTHKKVVEELEKTEIEFFGKQKVYKLFGEILADLPDVWFGKGWVQARAIMTSGIEPIMRGEISVADGLKKSADDMRRQLKKG